MRDWSCKVILVQINISTNESIFTYIHIIGIMKYNIRRAGDNIWKLS